MPFEPWRPEQRKVPLPSSEVWLLLVATLDLLVSTVQLFLIMS